MVEVKNILISRGTAFYYTCMTIINTSNLSLLVLSIAVLYFGEFITQRIKLLQEYNIPAPVTSGLLISAIFSILSYHHILTLHFSLEIRDLFLLMFFASIGLSSRLTLLISGGKILPKLLLVMLVFLILQNIIGVSSAMLLNLSPFHGLLAGTVSFAGGHGTAITWSNYFAELGHEGTQEFGLIAATLGLICGGLLGGPTGYLLIKNKKLLNQQYHLFNGKKKKTACSVAESGEVKETSANPKNILRILLELSITIAFGTYINHLLKKHGIIIPDYLLVLITGIIIVNVADLFKMGSNQTLVSIWGEVSLDLFVVMTLVSLNLSNLTSTAIPLLIITFIQCIFIVLFAYHVFFRFAGKDYDAAVISAGFIGSGLGATPVGMANVEAITHRFGASPKALLLIPLLGSFFTDIMNAAVLRAFLSLNIFQ